MKLQIKREALAKLNCQANEGELSFYHNAAKPSGFWHSLEDSSGNAEPKTMEHKRATRLESSDGLVGAAGLAPGASLRGMTGERRTEHIVRNHGLYAGNHLLLAFLIWWH